MKWHLHTEQPRPEDLPITALIVVYDRDEEEPLLMPGVHTMTVKTAGEWVDEGTWRPLRAEKFWWLSESDLMVTLPKAPA